MAYSAPSYVFQNAAREFKFDQQAKGDLRRPSSVFDPPAVIDAPSNPANAPLPTTSPSAFAAPPPIHHSHSTPHPHQHHILLHYPTAPQQQQHFLSTDCVSSPSATAAPLSSIPSLAAAAAPTPATATAAAAAAPFLSSLQYPYNQQQLYVPSNPSSVLSPTQLWMGDIDPWMDDECIRQVWACVGENVAVKMIRDRLTGGPANYCFIEVPTQADAERILSLYNAQPMPAPFARSFRLNWASGMPLGFNSALVPTAATASSPMYPASLSLITPATNGAVFSSLVPLVDAPEFSLFVGDLASEVTDIQLANEFRCRYASVRTAKVVTDPITNLPRGYGFVRFSDEADQQRALAEMQGKIIGSRAIRVSTATPKRTPTGTANYTLQQGDSASRDVAGSPASSTSSASSNALYNPATDPFNTTVFVGGLMHPVGEDELHAFFAVYGEVVYCKIPPNRGCGFVTFAKRANAETAMRALNGHTLGGSRIRLSWGRSQSHARHNHHRHHHHHHHHHHHNSSNSHHHNSSQGNSSGFNSHRNSVGEQQQQQQPALDRNSATASNRASGAPQNAAPALGLGLSVASMPAASTSAASPPLSSAALVSSTSQQHPAHVDVADGKQQQPLAAATRTGGAGHARSLHLSIPGLVTAAQPSSAPSSANLGIAAVPLHIQQQQLEQHTSGYNQTPHSAFYSVSPMHTTGTAAAAGADFFASTPNSSGVPVAQPSSNPGYSQQYYYYYQHQQQESSVLNNAAAASLVDSPPTTTADHYSHHQLLVMQANRSQFDDVEQQQQQNRHQLHAQQEYAASPSGTVLPTLASCPSELLSRRFNALALNNGSSNSDAQVPSTPSTASTSKRNSAVGVVSMSSLERRPSAGVIGQRRLSSKPSFHRTSQSQLSLNQLWPSSSVAGHSPTLVSQVDECHGALSTPVSSSRLSASSMLLLASSPSALNPVGGSLGNMQLSGDPRQQQQQQVQQGQKMDLGLDSDTIRVI